MATLTYLLAGIFLPLFPLSMAFNMLYARIRGVVMRVLLLLAWPQLGVALLSISNGHVPEWAIVLAVGTSLFYCVRALALRDVSIWISFLATSAWAVLWVAAYDGIETVRLHFYALGFSAPLVILALLVAELERRYGAAYTGLYGGLGHTLPRFSGVLVFVVLAVIATPLFPSFSTMLKVIVTALPVMPGVAVGLVGVWLIWSWAGARLLQGLIVGRASEQEMPDLSQLTTWAYVAAISAMFAVGAYGMGELV